MTWSLGVIDSIHVASSLAAAIYIEEILMECINSGIVYQLRLTDIYSSAGVTTYKWKFKSSLLNRVCLEWNL